MAARRVSIALANSSGRRVEMARLTGLLQRAAKAQGINGGLWQISLVNDRAMAALHQRTMDLPTTTDVLTFDLRDRGDQGPLDLDTVICADVARRQAAERGHALLHEILLYAVHSLLHVCGYDDLAPAAAAKMHAREDELLRAVGIGPVYAAKVTRRAKPARAARQRKHA